MSQATPDFTLYNDVQLQLPFHEDELDVRFHKFQGYWMFKWLLISRPVKLIEMRVSQPNTHNNLKKKNLHKYCRVICTCSMLLLALELSLLSSIIMSLSQSIFLLIPRGSESELQAPDGQGVYTVVLFVASGTKDP